MNRRGFLGSLAAAALAPFVPKIPAPLPPQLAFHPDAFAIVHAPLTLRLQAVAATNAAGTMEIQWMEI